MATTRVQDSRNDVPVSSNGRKVLASAGHQPTGGGNHRRGVSQNYPLKKVVEGIVGREIRPGMSTEFKEPSWSYELARKIEKRFNCFLWRADDGEPFHYRIGCIRNPGFGGNQKAFVGYALFYKFNSDRSHKQFIHLDERDYRAIQGARRVLSNGKYTGRPLRPAEYIVFVQFRDGDFFFMFSYDEPLPCIVEGKDEARQVWKVQFSSEGLKEIVWETSKEG